MRKRGIKCPKCKEEIDRLENAQSGIFFFECYIKNGEITYFQKEFEPDGITNEWRCPACDEPLFFSESKALEYLSKSSKNTSKRGLA